MSHDVSQLSRRQKLQLLSKTLRTFRLTDEVGLSELFLGSKLPTKARVAKHLRSSAVLLPPSITADFLAEHIVSAFVAAEPDCASDEPSMRILFLAANPTHTTHLDLEEELRSLEQELRGVKLRDSISLIAQHAVRPDDLVRHVRAEKPNVIHFSGHGSTTGIILRNDTGGHQAVEGEHLKRFLRGREVDLVFLNSCYSKHQADAIRSAVKTVVGTTGAVNDVAARRFTVAFYRSLGEGLSVRDAFRDAKDAVVLHGLTDVFHCGGDLDLVLVADPDVR